MKHNWSRTREYGIWTNMRQRCLNPKNPDYARYGGRGIIPCCRWDEFSNFIVDMGPAPQGYTLDRIDGTLGYSKENCRWATRLEQSHNSSRSRKCKWGSQQIAVAGLARRFGIHPKTVTQRLRKGWYIYRALIEPTRARRIP